MSVITEISLIVLAVAVMFLIFWYMKIDMQLRHARMMADLEQLHEAQRKAMAQWAHTETTTIEELLKPDSPEQNESQALEEEKWFLHRYRCSNCDYEWIKEWAATCNDECPVCRTTMFPYNSEALGVS